MDSIHIPEGVGEQGAIDNLEEAARKASICIPALLQAIVEELSDISTALYWRNRLAYLKAKEESLLTPEEIDRYEREMEGEGEDEDGDE